MELYKKYRPKLFKDILGQEKATSFLKDVTTNRSKCPHTMLFTGPSGCGKTTAARVLANKMGCKKGDLVELNGASSRGIDDIRTIERQMGMSAMYGDSRMWIIDECHKLTSDAQNALLKPTEETPDNVYFILCSSIPGKVISALKTRASVVKFELVPDNILMDLLEDVANKEGKPTPIPVLEKIVECSEGSARKALVFLEQVINIQGEENQIGMIEKSDVEKISLDLYKAITAFRPDWKPVSQILKDIKEEPETIRRSVLGLANKALSENWKNKERAYLVILAFRDHYFDCGKAGLSASCFEVVFSK